MTNALLSRRGFMQVGALALGGLTLPEILAAKEASGTSGDDTSVIMLYQHGGASQLETYDLKPDAPTSFRSVFNPIPTNVPGLDICELFPLQAQMADRFSLVRSLHHDVGIHSDGGIVALTGKRPTVLDPANVSRSAPFCVRNRRPEFKELPATAGEAGGRPRPKLPRSTTVVVTEV